MSKSTEAQREKARDTAKAKMLMAYVQLSGKAPEFQREDRKPYGGKVYWWLEPIIDHMDNYVLIEEYLGDGWCLRVDLLDLRKT